MRTVASVSESFQVSGSTEGDGAQESPRKLTEAWLVCSKRHQSPSVNEIAQVKDIHVPCQDCAQPIGRIVSAVVRVRDWTVVSIRRSQENPTSRDQHSANISYERLVVIDVLNYLNGDNNIEAFRRELRCRHIIDDVMRNV